MRPVKHIKSNIPRLWSSWSEYCLKLNTVQFYVCLCACWFRVMFTCPRSFDNAQNIEKLSKNRTWIRFHAAFEVINPLLLNIMLRPVVMYIRTIMIWPTHVKLSFSHNTDTIAKMKRKLKKCSNRVLKIMTPCYPVVLGLSQFYGSSRANLRNLE